MRGIKPARNPGTADGSNHISGLSYDSSGNTLTDGNNTYTWDGESQLKTAAGVTYNYDGDGRRAAKVGSKLYWYGLGGEILSETDVSGNTLNDYIFFGGKRVAMVPASGSALYYAEDSLGTSRVVVQSNGTLCYDGDFTPFGGERSCTSTCAQNYKFEGKERDTETQNDDFGARYYSWRLGRWLSSDWSAVPVPVPYANLTNPQTLNLYSMVADDPESFADLDGHEGFWTVDKRGTQNADGCDAGWVTCSSSEEAAQNQQTQPNQQAQNSNQAQAPETNSKHTWLYKILHPFGEDHSPTVVDLFQYLFVGLPCKIACAKNANLHESQKATESANQMAEASAGRGRAIAGAGTNKTLREAGRLASEYGGNPADWRKMATSNAVNKGMENFEIHYYQNIKTGQVVEMKTVPLSLRQ